MRPTPATSFVAALDEPWRFLRTRFSDWAPAGFGLAAIGLVPALLTQWSASAIYGSGGGFDPNAINFFALGGVYAGGCFTLLTTALSQLGAYVLVAKVLDGERPGLGGVLAATLAPRVLVVGGTALLVVLAGFGCLVGGPLLSMLVGFVPPILLARPGAWFSAFGVALTSASERMSPRDSGMPGFKLAAIAGAWYGLSMALGQLAAIPSFAWMVWHMVSTLGTGDVLAAMQMSIPFPVGALGALLGAGLRPFVDIYAAAAATLLWRDLVRVRAGADVEALLDARPAP